MFGVVGSGHRGRFGGGKRGGRPARGAGQRKGHPQAGLRPGTAQFLAIGAGPAHKAAIGGCRKKHHAVAPKRNRSRDAVQALDRQVQRRQQLVCPYLNNGELNGQAAARDDQRPFPGAGQLRATRGRHLPSRPGGQQPTPQHPRAGSAAEPL